MSNMEKRTIFKEIEVSLNNLTLGEILYKAKELINLYGTDAIYEEYSGGSCLEINRLETDDEYHERIAKVKARAERDRILEEQEYNRLKARLGK